MDENDNSFIWLIKEMYEENLELQQKLYERDLADYAQRPQQEIPIEKEDKSEEKSNKASETLSEDHSSQMGD